MENKMHFFLKLDYQWGWKKVPNDQKYTIYLNEMLYLVNFNAGYFSRKFVKNKSQKPESTSRRVLPEDEKLEFVRTSVSWIEGRDIMDSCFVLNFGYEAPLPWPQVLSVLY